MKYVVLSNKDYTEACMTELACWRKDQQYYNVDVDGRPMHVCHEFEAETWDDAIDLYNENIDVWMRK